MLFEKHMEPTKIHSHAYPSHSNIQRLLQLPRRGLHYKEKKVEKLRKRKREEEEDRGAMAARRAGAQA